MDPCGFFLGAGDDDAAADARAVTCVEFARDGWFVERDGVAGEFAEGGVSFEERFIAGGAEASGALELGEELGRLFESRVRCGGSSQLVVEEFAFLCDFGRGDGEVAVGQLAAERAVEGEFFDDGAARGFSERGAKLLPGDWFVGDDGGGLAIGAGGLVAVEFLFCGPQA